MSVQEIQAYADAMLLVAAAEGNTATLETELFAFQRGVEGSDELRSTLTDAKLPMSRRLQIVEDLVGDKVSATTLSVISLIVANGRSGDLGEIIKAVISRSAESRGEVVAEVRSAVALTEDQKQRLAAALKVKTNRDVAISNIVDPSVVGGVVTQIGDTLFDGSVRTRLTQLRESF